MQRAQWRRFRFTLACLETPEGTDAWVRLMIAALRAQKNDVFRWHDSGDIFSPAYARAVKRVVAGTPEITHWFPSQSHRIAVIAVVLREICQLPNVVIRPSCEQVDAPAVVVPGLSAGTQVITSPEKRQPARTCALPRFARATRMGSAWRAGCASTARIASLPT